MSDAVDDILGKFQQFSSGVVAQERTTVLAPATVTTQPLEIAAPLVNGLPVGEWAGDGWWVPVAQVELASAEDLLQSRYTPGEDPDFKALVAAVQEMGDHYPALPVLPAGKNLPDGAPIFAIYDLPHVYYALLDLHRARIKVALQQVNHPGEILLRALAEQGALRREPNIIEQCEAVLRLTDWYKYSDKEIAGMLAMNREDRQPPSEQQVHYLRIVGKLHPTVREMVFRKQITWSHAKYIAEAYGNDERQSIRLALLASQGTKLTVDQVRLVIKRLGERKSRLDEDEDGGIHEVRLDAAIHLVSDHRAETVVPYAAVMAARVGQIRTRLARYHLSVIPGEKPAESRVAHVGLEPLADFLSQMGGEVKLADLEAELQAVLIAVRQAGQQAGIITAEGVLATQIDAAHATKMSS
ncbi:MAG: hypothetical protein IVW57_16720 [Ktedonobacterales bacterium]|nr:hypothetical protein [Ktedonobacterales bacterium]